MTALQKRWNILRFNKLESTNTTALEWLKRNPNFNHSVIVAQSQEKGRGQRGTHWQDSDGKSLLMTLVIQPSQRKVEDRFALSMIFSLAIYQALKEFSIESEIKWPNDILINKKKVGGILIETGIRGNFISHALLGLGLNLQKQKIDFPHASTIEEESNQFITANDFLEKIEFSFKELQNKRFEEIKNQYLSRLVGFKKPETFEEEGVSFVGEIIDLEETGEIWIKKNSGEKLRYSFKEVKFIY